MPVGAMQGAELLAVYTSLETSRFGQRHRRDFGPDDSLPCWPGPREHGVVCRLLHMPTESHVALTPGYPKVLVSNHCLLMCAREKQIGPTAVKATRQGRIPFTG